MGRKSNDEVAIGKMAGLADDEVTLSRFKAGRGVELITADTLGGKFAELEARIGTALQGAAKAALTSGRMLNAVDLKVLVGQHRENERIIEALVGHLAQHVLTGTILEGAITAANRDVTDRAARIGEEHLKLVRRMIAMGLKAEDCRVNDGDLKIFVELLKARETATTRSLLGLPSRRQGVTDDMVAASEAEAMAIRAAAAARTPSSPAHYVEPPYVRQVPQGFLDPWQRAAGPAPRDFWSTDFKIPSAYQWEARIDETPEMGPVRDMPLPPHDTWDELREIDQNFSRVTKPGMMSRGSGETRLKTYFAAIRSMKEEEVPEAWIRAWIFLLYARHAPMEEIELKFGEAYFVGVSIPDPANGSFAVRTLRAAGA